MYKIIGECLSSEHTCTMTFCSCFFSMHIVRLVLWLENCLRNLINFVFFLKISVGLILAKVSVCGFPFPSTYLLGPSYLSLVSFALVVSPPLLTPSLVLFPQRSVYTAHDVTVRTFL